MERRLVTLLIAAASLTGSSCGKRPRGVPGGDRPDAEVSAMNELRPEKAEVSGCRDSLTGEWHAKEDPRYRYRIEDRGRVITVIPLLEDVPDGGHPSGGHVFEILRYPFSDTSKPRWPTGKLRFQAEPPPSLGLSKVCQIELAARITGCWKRSMVLASKINGKMDWKTCTVEESMLWNETPLER